MSGFKLHSEFTPAGGQPEAIEQIVSRLEDGISDQVLLGVTGSGKTFTIANAIARANRPALILAHNKILAAQLYGEFRELFPDNAVHYFISYYDYYQPEAYIPHSNTYIEKDVAINDHIDKMRHAATTALFERRDIVVVASVSAIYGIGAPEDYYGMMNFIEVGARTERDVFLSKLADIQYKRSNDALERGAFRVRGDVVEVMPSHGDNEVVRVEFFGDEVDSVNVIDHETGSVVRAIEKASFYPASHYVAPRDKMLAAVDAIKSELDERVEYFGARSMSDERDRIAERTRRDIEFLETMGFCPGIENYSRHLAGRNEGEPPFTLLDYFPDDFICVIDESHQTVPQIRGMHAGDRSRKKTLVEHGFRLPSAIDNRPLNFEEFTEKKGQTIYVSATPAEYEIEKSLGQVAEQMIRPTGLADPDVEVRPARGQVDDLLGEIRKVANAGERVLISTLTKKMAEDLTDYYRDAGVRVRYMHSEIETLERVRIIHDLRSGEFDALVGINLLREGLDIPEVALFAVLDADREGYLRSETSLIQMFGRAARNIKGRVIMYGDEVTGSMKAAMNETERRREIQTQYNKDNGITPSAIRKNLQGAMGLVCEADYVDASAEAVLSGEIAPEEIPGTIKSLTRKMKKSAKDLEFEKAASLKKRIKKLKDMEAEYIAGMKNHR
ncbi:MAG: excinuclease ABC subunit UvrB [Candidatus Mycalebacterium zealandia]|nr:MAG: excinuclease ABC subunit UvrB [Candidatus Mycalebacterium zealandia]